MNPEKRIRVATCADVPEDGTLLVNCGGEPVCLYNVKGKIYATHDACTHGAASLSEGFIQGDRIQCPLHQGEFEIRTGKAVGVPCVEDLKVFPVEIEGQQIYLLCSEPQGQVDP